MMETDTIICGDCLDVMCGMEAGSVDAIITDLPYFRVVDEDWDNQWKDRSEYLDWVVSLAHEWKRITKDNSSIFVFCDEKMEAYIQVRLDEIFLLLNKIVWFKRNNLPQKNAHLLRTFAPMTERALFYGNYSDEQAPSGFAQIIKNARIKSGYSAKYISEIGGFYGNVNHGGIISNWETGYSIPSFEQWEKLTKILPIHNNLNQVLQLHGSLRQEYETLRRPFNADKKTLDVLEFPIIGGDENTEHTTTKPLSLMTRIVSTITNPSQLILDCCCGSGSTLVAAKQTGRHFIGIDISEQYCKLSRKRVRGANVPLFSL